MSYEIKLIDGPGYLWDVVNTKSGKAVLKDESYQVADSVCFHLNNPNNNDCSESREVADSILESEATR
jgi:hypothetical protein